MKREICRCPYCGAGVIMVDDTTAVPELTGNDGACPHLTLANVSITVYDGASMIPEPSSLWAWSADRGDYDALGEAEQVDDYVVNLARDTLPADAYFPDVPFRLLGVFSAGCERRNTGTTVLCGWGIYSPDPVAAMADIRERARLWSVTAGAVCVG